MFDGEGAEGVKTVAFHPQVGVGQAHALLAGLGDPVQRRGSVALVRSDEAQPAGGQALPARIAQLQGLGVGVRVGSCCCVDLAVDKVDVGGQGFGQ
jgi:hypothetical protein